MIKTLLTAMVLLGPLTYSLAGESSHIEADHMFWSETEGITRFTGSVRYHYPAEKITILADRLELQRQGNKLLAVTADGEPVQFEQLAEAEKLIKGQATHLYYDAQTETVTLSGNAQLLSNNNSLRGELIVYDLHSQQAEVSGDGDSGKRFEAIIQSTPEQKDTAQ